MRNRAIKFVLVFAFGVLVGAATVVSAQVGRAPSQKPAVTPSTTTAFSPGNAGATLLPVTSMQLGLEVVGHRQGRVVGKLMAMENGKWVEVQLAPQDSYVGR